MLLAACLADATLLPRLHGEVHRAYMAARTRGDDWQVVDGRWADYTRNANSHLHFRDGEPDNSPRMQAGKLKAMRVTLEAREWFFDYRGPPLSAADRAALMKAPTAVAAERFGKPGETRWERDQRLEVEAENARVGAAA